MAEPIRSHHDLIVWQKAMDLSVLVYRGTRHWPVEERYGLTSQTKRAVSSVPANIAEGHARGTTRDYVHFLSIARGSLMETETFVHLAVRLEYLDEAEARPCLGLIVEIDKMLSAIRSKLGA